MQPGSGTRAQPVPAAYIESALNSPARMECSYLSAWDDPSVVHGCIAGVAEHR